jgi:tetraacyldisaccharide 4'-kinase
MLRKLLFPFSCLYWVATSFRNHLYQIGNKKSHQFDVFTIGVGNLRVGGTGKTPVCDYLLAFLSQNEFRASYLSRGYGRKTEGFLTVLEDSSSLDVGDEALEIKFKHPTLPVVVCEERLIGIPTLLLEYPSINAVVLDDVFQHRKVKPHLNLLLTVANDLFYNDYILPMGNLRESRNGASRADMVLVTKCEARHLQQKEAIKTELIPYLKPNTPIVFAKTNYKQPLRAIGKILKIEKCLLVSAIANNFSFLEHCQTAYQVIKHYSFRDHHFFSEKDIKEICNFGAQNNNLPWLTSFKDWQRLKNYIKLLKENEITVYVLPIEIEIDEPEIFNAKILEAAKGI